MTATTSNFGNKERSQEATQRFLFYRDTCLEWAALDHIPSDLAAIAENQGALWEGLAANVRRDAKLIANSRALIAEAENLLMRDHA
jgi:hypothetical protein